MLQGPRLGSCGVCFKADCRLTSSGVLYQHGPRSGPCPGTGRQPFSFNSHVSPNSLLPSTAQASSSQPLLPCSSSGATFPTTSFFSQPLPIISSSLQQPSASATTATLSTTGNYASLLQELFSKRRAPLIKWIPKSARRACATLLANLLEAVSDDPQSVEK